MRRTESHSAEPIQIHARRASATAAPARVARSQKADPPRFVGKGNRPHTLPTPMELPSVKEQVVLDVLARVAGAMTPLQIVEASSGMITKGTIYKTLRRMPAGLLVVVWGRETRRQWAGGPDVAPFYSLSPYGRGATAALQTVRTEMKLALVHARAAPVRPRSSWDLDAIDYTAQRKDG